MLGDVEQGRQEGESRTHYRVTPFPAVFVCVDSGTDWEVERSEMRQLWENGRVGQTVRA